MLLKRQIFEIKRQIFVQTLMSLVLVVVVVVALLLVGKIHLSSESIVVKLTGKSNTFNSKYARAICTLELLAIRCLPVAVAATPVFDVNKFHFVPTFILVNQ